MVNLSFRSDSSRTYRRAFPLTPSGVTMIRMLTAPGWTGAANVDYELGDVRGWKTRLSGSWRYIDSQYSVISSQPPVGLLPSYSLVDLNLQCSAQRVNVSLYAKNLLEKRVFNIANPTTDNTTGASYFHGSVVQPRTLGISFNVDL
jgi:hypothetical protein